jgi:hypothetical protein
MVALKEDNNDNNETKTRQSKSMQYISNTVKVYLFLQIVLANIEVSLSLQRCFSSISFSLSKMKQYHF